MYSGKICLTTNLMKMGTRTWQTLMSIILVFDNNLDQILNTLAQLEKLRVYNFGFETIICEVKSSHDLEDEIRSFYPEVVLVKAEGNESVSRVKNRAATICKSDVFLFLDPVFHISPLTLITLYQQKIIHKDYSILTARQQDHNGKDIVTAGYFNHIPMYDKFPDIILSIYNWMTRDNSAIENVDWVCESLMMIDKQSFRKVGGWLEDDHCIQPGIELSSRILEQSGKIGYLNNLIFLNLSSQGKSKHPLYISKNRILSQSKKN